MRYLLAFLFLTTTAYATLNEVDKTQINTKQLLVNGGFENGKAKWTASAGTFTVTGSSPMIGLYHGVWDAAASADTLTTTAVTIPAGFYGRNGVASCVFTTASGTATHEIQAYDGSTVLSEATITSSTSPVRTSTNFIFPSSGSISLRIYANANEPSITIDDCFLTLADGFNISNVSQATFIGSAYIAATANCTPTLASTTLVAFNTDADCPGPTIDSNPGPGIIQTTDANGPIFTVNNLPPGRYKVTISGQSSFNTAAFAAFAINDGTDTKGAVGGENGTASGYFSTTGWFEYVNSGNKTFTLYASASANTITLQNGSANNNTRFEIVRYPLSQEQVFRADTIASSWSGYHDSTCSWAQTSTSFADPSADATCTLTERTNQNFGTVTSSGSVLPNIVFTPSRVGIYYVCANIVLNVSNQTGSARLWDGTTVIAETDISTTSVQRNSLPLCGMYSISTLASKTISVQTRVNTGTMNMVSNSSNATIEWSIFQIDQSFPAPLLAGNVTSSSSGSVRIETAKVNCDGSSSIASQVGSWVSSVGNIASGMCSLTISAGVFSATPYCWFLAEGTSAASGNAMIPTLYASSSTALSFGGLGHNGANVTSVDAVIFCMGAR